MIVKKIKEKKRVTVKPKYCPYCNKEISKEERACKPCIEKLKAYWGDDCVKIF